MASRPDLHGRDELTSKETLTVIGAGILGMAIALEFSRHGYQVTVLEKESRVACHQTGRNSGVIHAGPYYKPGSLKARLCASGSRSLIEFASRKGVPFRQTGKLIVATSESSKSRVNEIFARATANGVDVALVGKKEIRELEPNCPSDFGLHVRATGIIDYNDVTLALHQELKELGGEVVFGAEVQDIFESKLTVTASHAGGHVESSLLISAAGLQSDRIAKLAGLDPEVTIYPFRGEYFDISPDKSHLVRGLIYPAPDPELPFLGVHVTKTLSGQLHAGPNAILGLSREGYKRGSFSFRDAREIVFHAGFLKFLIENRRYAAQEMLRLASKEIFAAEISKLVSGITAQDLTPAPTGIRAQAMTRQGKLVDDFVIQRKGRQVHVLNAPSPAATASLAIAQHIRQNL